MTTLHHAHQPGRAPRLPLDGGLIPQFLLHDDAQPACSPVTAELFHGIENSREWAYMKDAIRICAGCPVRVGCLNWALEHDEKTGVWGGLLPSERDRLKYHNPELLPVNPSHSLRAARRAELDEARFDIGGDKT